MQQIKITKCILKLAVFYDVSSCSLINIYGRFRGTYCLTLKIWVIFMCPFVLLCINKCSFTVCADIYKYI